MVGTFKMRPRACGFKMIIGLVWFGFAFRKQGHVTAFRIFFLWTALLVKVAAGTGGSAAELPAWLGHSRVVFGGVS